MEATITEENTKKDCKNPSWFCKRCLVYFKSRRLLYAHKKAFHIQVPKEHLYNYYFNEQTEKFTCKICSLELKIRDMMEQHVLLHEEKFTCEVCEETVHSPYRYSLHLQKHNPKAGFRCPLCNYKTVRQLGVLMHISRVHLKRYRYLCKHCGKGFDDVVTYKEHENGHVNFKAVACIVCKKEFVYTRNLIYHQMLYHRVSTMDPKLENQCGICKKSFTTKKVLKEHVNSHTKTNNAHQHLCEWCGKSFKEKNSFTKHVMSHSSNKRHKCSYCDKAFTRKGFLTVHERIHSGEKPYACTHCEKAFNQPTALKRHIRCHTGERPYVCEACGVSFTSKTALNKHVITRCC